MDECIFCKIMAGEASCRKLYEDETVLCMLDIGQIFSDTGECTPGRSLIIPKKHVTWFYDLEDEEAGHLFIVAKKIAPKIKKAFNPDFVTVIIRGQRVSHAHIILQPTVKDDPFDNLFANLAGSFRVAPDELLNDIALKIQQS